MEEHDSDKRAQILQLVQEGTTEVKQPRTRRRSAQVVSTGDQNVIAGRDINVNVRKVSRTQFTPGPEHLSQAQAHRIQEIIAEAVDLQASSGKTTKGKLFQRWWSQLKRRFRVPTYLAIPREQYEEVISWLQQQKARVARPAARRGNNQAWRQSLNKAIFARIRELGLQKRAIYEIAAEKLGEDIGSLNELGERDLKRLYDIIFAMPRQK